MEALAEQSNQFSKPKIFKTRVSLINWMKSVKILMMVKMYAPCNDEIESQVTLDHDWLGDLAKTTNVFKK